jgi:hypothetical protein
MTLRKPAVIAELVWVSSLLMSLFVGSYIETSVQLVFKQSPRFRFLIDINIYAIICRFNLITTSEFY